MRSLGGALIIGLVAAGMSAGCGDDDGPTPSPSEEEEPYVAALVSMDWGDALDQREIHCVSTVLVQGIGVDAFEEAGMEPADLEGSDTFMFDTVWEPSVDSEQTEQMIEGLDDCGVLATMAALTVDPIAGGPITGEERTCIADELDEAEAEELVRVIVFGFGSFYDRLGSHLHRPVEDVLEACGVVPPPGR